MNVTGYIISAILGFLACDIAYIFLTSPLWHALFHRHNVHGFLHNRIICARCVDEYTEEDWRANLVRKLDRL